MVKEVDNTQIEYYFKLNKRCDDCTWLFRDVEIIDFNHPENLDAKIQKFNKFSNDESEKMKHWQIASIICLFGIITIPLLYFTMRQEEIHQAYADSASSRASTLRDVQRDLKDSGFQEFVHTKLNDNKLTDKNVVRAINVYHDSEEYQKIVQKRELERLQKELSKTE